MSLGWHSAWGQPPTPEDRFSPIQAGQGMVVTSEPLATQAGITVLKQGGNAIDAAVTIGFVMAVTYPGAGNLGGGGFMLIHQGKTGKTVAIDYRERAPERAHRDMFIDSTGHVDPKLSRFSHLAAGVPGTVAGLALALERYGTLSLAQALAPAIQLAEAGFKVTPTLSAAFKRQAKTLKRWPASRAIFFKNQDQFYEPGDHWQQPQLAKTLKLLAQHGTEAFYHGNIAQLIVDTMQQHQGLITQADLADYQAVIRTPVWGHYRGYDICSMSPPSSGGIHIIQILNMLEHYDIGFLGHNRSITLHLMTEAMKRAYADRSKYLGDPDFVRVPVKALIAKDYAQQLVSQINRFKATPSQHIQPGTLPNDESEATTHYSIADNQGNAVANTYTLNFEFGSGIVVTGTGFLLNNQMDDFSAQAGVANAYGLIGGNANAIEPKKRMLSSMSPTLVLKANKPFLITGSPGGSRIITTTVQVIMNVIDHHMNIQEAVNAIRIHHQWLPDQLQVEADLNLDTFKLLTDKGHTVMTTNTMGAANSILIESGHFYGAADPRTTGLALGF